MTEEHMDYIMSQMLTPEFYLRDFRTEQDAADYLEVTKEALRAALNEYEDTLFDFIYAMRIDDVKDRLARNAYESYRSLARHCQFHSRIHLLWRFYKCELCFPRQWAYDQGLIL